MRGEIVAARLAYPDVLHVEIRDSSGELWRLATQDAEWSPSDPSELVGNAIEDAGIDDESGELRCKLSNGRVLDIKPAAQVASDDPPNWELITPGRRRPGVRARRPLADQQRRRPRFRTSLTAPDLRVLSGHRLRLDL